MNESQATGDSAELARLRAEQSRLAAALAIAERDRQLLGYEIHDEVVQDLSAAAMLLEGASRQATFTARDASENHSDGLRLLHEAIAKARAVINGTATIDPDQTNLCASLTRLAKRFQSDYGLPVSVECTLAEQKVPASVQHLLLRIAQESLVNAWKHARASEVEVRLATEGDCLILTIADNGVGFDPAQVPQGHFGLEGIRARARALAADLLVDTAPHHGTRIVVRLPASSIR